jgi:hypothetical protein
MGAKTARTASAFGQGSAASDGQTGQLAWRAGTRRRGLGILGFLLVRAVDGVRLSGA